MILLVVDDRRRRNRFLIVRQVQSGLFHADKHTEIVHDKLFIDQIFFVLVGLVDLVFDRIDKTVVFYAEGLILA